VYLLEGTCLPGQCVAFGGDTLSYTVSAGIEYFVLVDGTNISGGNFVLHIECPVVEEGETEGEGEAKPKVEPPVEGEVEGETEGEPPV
jgi:hypothetical protein